MVAETALYDLLNISPSASATVIKKAFHKIALANHPDKVVDPEKKAAAEQVFREAQHAFDILRDSNSRSLYDQYGSAAFEPNLGANHNGQMDDMEELFSQFFSTAGQDKSRKQTPRSDNDGYKSPDVVLPYAVTLQDLYNGKRVRLNSERNIICTGCSGSGAKRGTVLIKCPSCDGRGTRHTLRRVGPGMVTRTLVECSDCSGAGRRIKDRDRCRVCKGKGLVVAKKKIEFVITKGMMNGDEIRLRGETDEEVGKITGDVRFILTLKSHDTFEIAGHDLRTTVHVSLAEALTGVSRIVLIHLNNHAIKLTYPPKGKKGKFLRPGQVLVLKNQGMPYGRDAKSFGNLFVVIEIDFPPDGTFLDKTVIDCIKLNLPNLSRIEVGKAQNIVEADVHESDQTDFGNTHSEHQRAECNGYAHSQFSSEPCVHQ